MEKILIYPFTNSRECGILYTYQTTHYQLTGEKKMTKMTKEMFLELFNITEDS